MRKIGIAIAAAAIVMANGAATPVRAATLTFQELLARPRPAPTARIQYGTLPRQFGELYLPSGAGPHPVVVLIHGGCWLAHLPGPEMMAYAADDLRKRGAAVWSITYRRLGDAGGGYPGTFEDVAHAFDWLKELAKRYPLDLGKIAAVGHSAGGQLALWAAARPRLRQDNPLYGADPLRVTRVVSLAGIGDLEAYRNHGPGLCSEPRTVDYLVGRATRGPWDLYSDTSPRMLLPIGVPQTIIAGMRDTIVPAPFSRVYAEAALAAGDKVDLATIPDAGHFELIDPTSSAFEKVRAAIGLPLK